MDEANKLFRSNLSELADLHTLIKIIPGRLYFAVYLSHRQHVDTASLHFFAFDRKDVGTSNRSIGVNCVYEPLDLGYLAEYIRCLNDKMYNRQYESNVIVHYATNDYRAYNDAALLIGVYMISVKQMNPKTIHSMLKNNDRHTDVSLTFGYNKNNIDLYDCLSVIYKAVKYKLIDFNNFSCQKYYGSRDLTWIVPNKLVAFRGPIEGELGQCNDLQYYVKYFQNNNIKTVIRLNSIAYSSSWFSNAGIEHVDLYCTVGTAPSNPILQTFLHISDVTSNAVAVHCRDGLERTGTLIAAYLMQHYRLSGGEAVAWLRMCRPGSIIAPQLLSFLVDKQNMLWKQGDVLRKEKYGHAAKVTYNTHGIYNANCRIKSSSTCDWNIAVKCRSNAPRMSVFGR